MNQRRNAFTLVEILVVLAIIAILAAILFPAFNRAKENAQQVNCASNLSQIYTAVQLYRQDENRYPSSLMHILAEGAEIDARVSGATTGVAGTLDNRASGYYKGGQSTLICQDDDTVSEVPRSSYGFLSGHSPSPSLAPGQIPSTSTADLSQYVWNYWGTRDDGFTFATPTDAATATAMGTNSVLLVNPALPYNQQYASTFNINSPENVVKYSMSNRFAPTSTIITHCIYHRLPTANNIATPGELYAPAPVDGANVKDIVLRLDGVVKTVDVSQWKIDPDPRKNPWQTQTK